MTEPKIVRLINSIATNTLMRFKLLLTKGPVNMYPMGEDRMVHMTRKSPSPKHATHNETISRIRRASGHLNKVETMVAEGQNCTQILQQLSAVISALESCRVNLLQDHFKSCIAPALPQSSKHLVEELETIINRALK